MTGRETVGAAIIVLWLVGLAALARRELFVDEPEQMAEAALLVVPGTAYYEVLNGGAHVGWASSSIDTSRSGISMRDVMVMDVEDSAGARRIASRARVSLTPALRLTGFTFELSGNRAPYRVRGQMAHDTVLTLITNDGRARPDTGAVVVRKAVFWPTTVPLALALAERPKVGRTYHYSIYDPTTGTPEDVSLTVGAESLFVVPDSAERDARGEWVVAHADTVRGWRLDPDEPALISGWIDERGRVLESSPRGTFTLRRTAYEMAFRNWTPEARKRAAATSPHHLPTIR
jgi:hypothetical protein